jgi:hypothetical protein
MMPLPGAEMRAAWIAGASFVWPSPMAPKAASFTLTHLPLA